MRQATCATLPFAASMPRLEAQVEPYRVLAEDGSVVAPEPPLSPDQLREIYHWMLLGRTFDERAIQLQRQGRVIIWGPYSGQEAAQAGLGLAMADGDWIFPSYRDILTLMMRGVDPADILGYLRGAFWLSDPRENGVFPVQILIGDQALHAVGAGMAFRLQGRPAVAVGSVGDGATSQGDFHEALNFAGVFEAQSLIFIQNNGWAISVPRSRQTAAPTLAHKALAHGLEGVLVDGNDPLATYVVCHWALERARAGEGTAVVEAVTYRLLPHTTSDDPRRYQTPELLSAWQQRDPIPRFRRYLERRGLWDDGAEQDARRGALARVDEAIERMEQTPIPQPERIFETTYASPTPDQLAQRQQMQDQK